MGNVTKFSFAALQVFNLPEVQAYARRKPPRSQKMNLFLKERPNRLIYKNKTVPKAVVSGR